MIIPLSAHHLIPKVFHQIWLGKEERSSKFFEYSQSWIQRHPDWEYKLWADKDVFLLCNQSQYDASRTMAQKADILRYEILQRFGGVYIDTDFECLKNIEDLISDMTAFSAFEDDRGAVAIGIMGAIPGHPVFIDVVARLSEGFDSTLPPCDTTGPRLFTNCVQGRTDIHIFPHSVFYPQHYSGHVWGPLSEAYAVHHWAHSWKNH
jgi:mannosyltransferase OCH1-like enzyme